MCLRGHRGDDGGETEIYLSGNFGQATFDPPRIVINPNRLYPIEGMIRRARRFSVSVLSSEDRDEAIRLSRLRRRQPRKTEVLGWALEEHEGIPYVPWAIQTMFCELETALDTGDHTVMVARVVEIRADERRAGAQPLMYREVAGEPPALPAVDKLLRKIVVGSPLGDALKGLKNRLRPAAPPDLPGTTYRQGGQTEAEVEQILSHGAVDRGCVLKPGGTAPVVGKADRHLRGRHALGFVSLPRAAGGESRGEVVRVRTG